MTKNPHMTSRNPAKQGAGTPDEFLDAVEVRFGPIGFDLAAEPGSEVAKRFFSPEQDALKQNWASASLVEWGEVVWLNPPFANIRPWVAKLEAECRWLSRWTLCLVPASMGSKWWADHVLGKCYVDGIPRMKFEGEKDYYPKDLALLCYGFGVSGQGYWDFRKPLIASDKQGTV